MKIAVVGGGPAGLYAGLLIMKSRPSAQVTLFERNPPDATYGWGVIFSDRTLASFREADRLSCEAIVDCFVPWEAIDVYYRDTLVRCGGHAFAGIARRTLLHILQQRAAELGVELRFAHDVSSLDALNSRDTYDVIVAADGVHSAIREEHRKTFGPAIEEGTARYIWLGTNKVLDSFTFIFRESPCGLFQAHAYPFSGDMSTFIVECSDATWMRAGLDGADEEAGIAFCQDLFQRDLGHARLRSNNSRWISFPTLTCRTWRHGRLVLLGDAAHTAHFSIGSGTKLAMEDAIALADALAAHEDVGVALAAYEAERKPVVEALQEAARDSRTYFEHTARYLHLDPPQFAFHLLTRSGRISYDSLRVRDGRFVDGVERWFWSRATDRRRSLPASPPLLAPLPLRGVTLPNRLVCDVRVSGTEGAPEALPPALAAGAAEAGVVLMGFAAVALDGRISPDTPGMYEEAHADAWAGLVQAARDVGAQVVGLTIGHAGRRGATRPRREGLDVPLRGGGWPLLSASALPYAPGCATPRAMERRDMERVCHAFVRAAELTAAAGFDVLRVDCGHGYLLGSFLSPLTNHRDDDYGGSLESRLRYPLEVFASVRTVWPSDRPIVIMLTVDDCVRGGTTPDDGVEMARAFGAAGGDLVEVLAGQTTEDGHRSYRRGFLTRLSDLVRNEACIPTIIGGVMSSGDEANGVLASGRADLVFLKTAMDDLPAGAPARASDGEGIGR